MPEIKHNFTGGRMNKDLDERLIPQGEYRHAMNINVSTSDGSDVGAAQNIQGNEMLSCNNLYDIPANSRVVASISDEKNDAFYWFISGQYIGVGEEVNTGNAVTSDNVTKGLLSSISQGQYDTIFNSWSTSDFKVHGFKDMIIGHGYPNTDSCSPIFVDMYAYITPTQEGIDITVSGISGQLSLSGIDERIVNAVRPGWEVRSVHKGVNSSTGYNEIIASDPVRVIDVVYTQNVLFTTPYSSQPADLFFSQTYAWALNQVIANVTVVAPSPAFPAGGYVAAWASSSGGFQVTVNDYSNVPAVPTPGVPFTINFVGLLSNIGNDAGVIVLSGGIITPSQASFAAATTNATMLLFYAGEDRALNFNHNRLITGINIVDDMLFWTDDYSEPKKINIKRSEAGTDPDGNHHTKLVNNYQDISDELAREEHITVIKKSPNQTLSIDLSSSRQSNIDYTAVMKVADGLNSFAADSSFLQGGQVGQNGTRDFSSFSTKKNENKFFIGLESNIDGDASFKMQWKVGDLIAFEPFTDSSSVAPATPITGGDGEKPAMICEILDWNDYNGYTSGNVFNNQTTYDPLTTFWPYSGATIKFKIIEINGVLPSGDPGNGGILNYALDLYQEYEKLFEYKLPRFSYRYKYEDGEYSTFAPWSSVAFLPGNYIYHPKKGFNLGMVNTVKTVVLSDFVGYNTPKDVQFIDILYKDDSGPNIYIVDTISSKDEPTITIDGNLTNHWAANRYTLDTSAVQQLLPSNQLLRVWDNVPRKARSQEVSGSRIIYGNYVQNYNLEAKNYDNPSQTLVDSVYSPRFITSLNEYEASIKKSIKSLREYQLGVVFSDKYGRETPVLTNKTGTIKVGKLYAQNTNKLEVSLIGGVVPEDMVHFKFFIKETAGEYYNLALDRYYDAQDGNVWLSFPSSDRNKVNIDTFLILKKGQNSNSLVVEKARYKILSIENEAPDFIKTTTRSIAKKQNDDGSGDLLFDTNFNDCPRQYDSTFKVRYSRFKDSTAADMHKINLGGGEKLYAEFSNKGNSTSSEKYKIIEISADGVPDTTTGAVTPNWIWITVDRPFGEDINFISDDSTGVSSSEILETAICSILKSDLENKPQFDGRFFVKIFADSVFDNYIKTNTNDQNSEYRVSSSRLLYRGYFGWNDPSVQMNLDGDGPITSLDILTNNMGNSPLTWVNRVKQWETFYGTNAWQAEKTQTTVDNKWSLDGFSNALSNTATIPVGMWYIDSMFTVKKLPTDNLPATSTVLNETTATNSEGGHAFYDSTETSIHYYDSFDISFGPIEPKIEFVSSGSTINDDYSLSSQDGHFGIGINNYIEEGSFGSKLYPGYQFRWQSDPTQRIYTIEEVKVTRQMNHTGEWNNNAANSDLAENYYWDETLPKFSTPWYSWRSNFSKRYSITFSPRIHFDDDFSPGGDGINGLYGLNKDEGLGQVIKQGDHISIAGITYGTNEIVGNASISGDPFAIFVGSLYGTDLNTGENKKIKVGMVVESYNNGTLWPQVDVYNDAGLTNRPVISSIEKKSNTAYKLFLAGSRFRLTNKDVDVTPTSGQDYVFGQLSFNGYSPYSALSATNRVSQIGNIITPILTDNQFDHAANANLHGTLFASGHIMEFIEPYEFEMGMPEDPAVFETEADKDSNLNIYYEASDRNAVELNSETINDEIPIGSNVIMQNGEGGTTSLFVSKYLISNSNTIVLSEKLCAAVGTCTDLTTSIVTNGVVNGASMQIIKPSGSTIFVTVNQTHDIQVNADGDDVSDTFEIEKFLYNNTHGLDWHNCYAWGNGVESNRIRDDFNLPFISNGVIASTTLETEYKEEHRKHGLIYSGLYNSTAGLNNLNQFITAEKITKDINPIYGSIQKLHSRNSDLVALCEDKILKILANKDAVFNADGNPALIATPNVLGQVIPFGGEYGISKNPESFASANFRVYFTDKTRGTVLRLSKDGITPISESGMRDWFRDNLELANNIIGSYDPREQEYNVTLRDNEYSFVVNSSNPILKKSVGVNDTTLSFKENVKGWVSFKSFINWNGIGSSNNYYTFRNGNIWKHHSKNVDRNNFYGNPSNSSLNVILNDSTSLVKSFTAINYEGDQARVDGTGTAGADGEYYNIFENLGWWCERLITEQDTGTINEFIKKEGKWFNYIKGLPLTISNGQIGTTSNGIGINAKVALDFNAKNSAHQGLGLVVLTQNFTGVLGCTDLDAVNYDSNATVDDGTCTSAQAGCTDAAALNYFIFATVDDGSCTYNGCTDGTTINGSGFNTGGYNGNGQGAINYNPSATIDDGSCIYCNFGCTDASQFNYDANATCDDGSCIAFVPGCTDSGNENTNVINYNASANIDDGSCDYSGCTTPSAINFMRSYQQFGHTNVNGLTGENLTCWDTQQDYPFALTIDTIPFPGPSLSYLNIINGYQSTNSNPPISFIPACATVDDGSCDSPGCVDVLACNYDATATQQVYVNPVTGYTVLVPSPGYYTNCLLCNDPDAFNYDGASCNSGCSYCEPVTNVNIYPNQFDNPQQNLSVEFTLPVGVPIASSTSPSVVSPVVSGVESVEICIGQSASTPPWGFNVYGDIGCWVINHNTLSEHVVEGGVTIYDNSGLISVQVDFGGVAGFYGGQPAFEALPNTDYKVRVSITCINKHENDPFLPNGNMTPHTYTYLQAPTHQDTTTTFPYAGGCTDTNWSNYDPNAQTNDGSCSGYLACNDPDASNWIVSQYNPLDGSTFWILGPPPGGFVDDGSCIYTGCQDPTYCGYNANATSDGDDLDGDGVVDSCLDASPDATAMNYVPNLPPGCIGTATFAQNPFMADGFNMGNYFSVLYWQASSGQFTSYPTADNIIAGSGSNAGSLDAFVRLTIPNSWPTPNMLQQGYAGIGTNGGSNPNYNWPNIHPNKFWYIKAQYRELGTGSSGIITISPLSGIRPANSNQYAYGPGDMFYDFGTGPNAQLFGTSPESNYYGAYTFYPNKSYEIRYATFHAVNPQLTAQDKVQVFSDWTTFHTNI